MLEIENIDDFHRDVQALRPASLSIKEGEIVSLVGSNAAGKSKPVNTVAGLQSMGRKDPLPGQLRYEHTCRRSRKAGLALIPAASHLFPFISVMANLELGGYAAYARRRRRESLETIFSVFHTLADRRD